MLKIHLSRSYSRNLELYSFTYSTCGLCCVNTVISPHRSRSLLYKFEKRLDKFCPSPNKLSKDLRDLGIVSLRFSKLKRFNYG